MTGVKWLPRGFPLYILPFLGYRLSHIGTTRAVHVRYLLKYVCKVIFSVECQDGMIFFRMVRVMPSGRWYFCLPIKTPFVMV